MNEQPVKCSFMIKGHKLLMNVCLSGSRMLIFNEQGDEGETSLTKEFLTFKNVYLMLVKYDKHLTFDSH